MYKNQLDQEEQLKAEKEYKLTCERKNDIENPYDQYCKRNLILKK